MMLAHAERIDANRLGVQAFGHDIPQRLRLRDKAAAGVEDHVTKSIKAQFDHRFSMTHRRVVWVHVRTPPVREADLKVGTTTA